MTTDGNKGLTNRLGNILVVDDDQDIIFFVKQALESEGIEVSCAESGEQALELLTERSYSALLTDQIMPGIDGFQLARHARRIQPALTIFMGTGHLYPGIEERATAAGIREVFGKPFNFQRLFEILLETVSREQIRQTKSLPE